MHTSWKGLKANRFCVRLLPIPDLKPLLRLHSLHIRKQCPIPSSPYSIVGEIRVIGLHFSDRNTSRDQNFLIASVCVCVCFFFFAFSIALQMSSFAMFPISIAALSASKKPLKKFIETVIATRDIRT